MFKKKVKKDQGVLLADEPQPEELPRETVDLEVVEGKGQTGKELVHLTTKQSQKQSQGLSKGNSKVGGLQNDLGQIASSNLLKRSKSQDIQYLQDTHSNLQNQPKRKQKDSFGPPKTKAGINASTLSKNEETSKQVHEAFSDIAYRAGDNLIKDLQLPADELQQQVAKRRFMLNVETTKMVKQGKLNSKMYRGMNAYANHKMTENDISKAGEAYKKKMGPSRLNSTIKNSCRFDYVLNLCKDWHDSGYCPFGNSCLYLHDRSNHKTGWELEKQFEEEERERWKRINNPQMAKKEDRQKLLQTIEKYKPPQLCQGCHQKLKNAVQVECGHIFCSPCALKMLKCKTCSKRLSGIMNNASEKMQKMHKDYQEMVSRLQVQQQQSHQKRRKFQNTDSLSVFND